MTAPSRTLAYTGAPAGGAAAGLLAVGAGLLLAGLAAGSARRGRRPGVPVR